MERVGRRRRQLLVDFRESRSYWKFGRSSTRSECVENCFGKGKEPVVKQTRE